MNELLRGRVPANSFWGPQVEGDTKAKAVKDALGNPAFFICFYTEGIEADKTDLLIHGRVQIQRLYHIAHALDELIIEQEKIALAQLQKPDKPDPQLDG